MPLPDGDYRSVEKAVANTLLADTGPGGLFEQGAPEAGSVKVGDEGLSASYGTARFPAIFVNVKEKAETPPAPAYSVTRVFALSIVVMHRGMDREDAEAVVKRVAARAEEVLRNQTATGGQFGGLPENISGAEGTLHVTLPGTVFENTIAKTDGVVAIARIDARLHLPCEYRYE